MMSLRPVVIDENNMILGGDKRYHACKELKWDEIPCLKADSLTAKQKEEFIIKDNLHSGQWDTQKLLSWDREELAAWGLDDIKWIELSTSPEQWLHRQLLFD